MVISRLSSQPALPLDEPFRPQFHFTPPEKWVNDPNGMVYYGGEYHLFYQYYPDDTVWGPMHWGHAVSLDLVNWQHLPIALYPDDLGYIFSGSAVIDWHNTAGFGKDAMVAIYTYHDPDNSHQSQAVAYSTDKGRTWTKYEGNPVIPTPPNIRNFRDPKVMWYDAGNDNGHWVMSLAAGSAILFYTSPNLVDWEASGSFGFGYGSTSGVWETPDLFELPVGGSDQSRWVLTVGVGNGAPAGGSGTQYFVGTFDGQTFTSENPKGTVLWADYGADFYAAQSWSDAPAGRRLWLAWMNNWQYARDIPTSTWRGAMTIPREVGLVQTDEGVRLIQTAVSELTQLRTTHHTWQNLTLTPNTPFAPDVRGETLEIVAEIEVPVTANKVGIRVRVGGGEETAVGYAPKSNTLFVDRSRSGQGDFHGQFATIHTAQFEPADGLLRLHMFVDKSSVEVFVNGGLVTFTDQIFPREESVGIELFVEGETAVFVPNFEVYGLKTARFFMHTSD
ncbi:MAG: glycoside hydrolase family 32 protein [Anaerolineales bacterium]|nr:glycoside hydrolase family 32 protein [Anaerolineales bacterium]MCB9430890.1 glycoside hydrolase family 32 protein [Ardenticatenaceae bacterium]